VEALQALRDHLDRTRMHALWAALPVGHVWNLMALNSGPLGRAVPARCEVVYGIGLIGEERLSEMRALVEGALAEVTAADPWLAEHPPLISWRGIASEPSVCDPGHPAVQSLARAVRTVANHDPAIAAASVVTDARHLANAGRIPSINFGPGATRRAHSPNETIPLADLRTTIRALALLLQGEAIGSAASAAVAAGAPSESPKPAGPTPEPA
jgi:acetylornithine deacetylase